MLERCGTEALIHQPTRCSVPGVSLSLFQYHSAYITASLLDWFAVNKLVLFAWFNDPPIDEQPMFHR